MADLALAWDEDNFEGDLLLTTGDIAVDETIVSSILIALYLDARAPAGQLPAGETDPRGHWADSARGDDVETGSLLWLLRRAKTLPSTLEEARGYAAEALSQLVPDYADRFEIEAEYLSRGRLGLTVRAINARPVPGRSTLRLAGRRRMDGQAVAVEGPDGTLLTVEW